MARSFNSNPKNFVPVEQAVKTLLYIEKVSAAVRAKIEKDQAVPSWLMNRIQQAATELNLLSPFLSSGQPKKFQPSSGSES